MSRTAIAMLLMVGLGTSPALAAPIGAQAMSSQALTPDAVPNATGNLVYNGGPVLQNVKVFTVYWGNNVQFSSPTGTQSLDQFYKAVIASPYYDWLNEYNTTSPVQKFGRGTFAGTYAYTNGATGTLQDSSIQSAIGSLIDSGKLPAPDANTLYAIHFAPGINIKMSDGSASCQVFCAYHSSFSHGGKNVYYSINPDQGGSCAGGCGSDASTFNNTTSVASHELVEATTDPNVGSNSQSQLGWYDNTNGEIGDICNASQCKKTTGATTSCPTTYVVQNEWSNKKKACISQDPTLVVNDFSVATTPDGSMAINVPQGGMTTVMVALTKTAGSSETVNFTATAPTDVTATFAPTSAMSDGGKTTLTISAKATAMVGMGTVTVSAAGSSTHTADLKINVTAPPDMAMSPDLAMPSGGGNGGNGGGGNGGNGGGGSGGTGTGGNGTGGNGNNGGGGGDSGCSMSGGSIAGSWAFAGVLLLALAFRRRRA